MCGTPRIGRVFITWQNCGTRVSETPASPLARVRKHKLLSQRDLAKRAGVALSTIYLLEAGKTERVTFKVMRAVSQALDVAPDAIAEFRRALDLRSD
jgi:transcriptional regulator with XRE-family HTH domain